jgi:hypothetical protein
MGFGFVSYHLYLLLPPRVLSRVASLLWCRARFVHVLLVGEATTGHPWVLQYPLGSKMRNASACVYTRGTYGTAGKVWFGGGVVGGTVGVVTVVQQCCCCMVLTFVVSSSIFERRCAITALLLVAALAMLSRYPVMLVLFFPVTLLAAPNDCGLAFIRRLRSMWAIQYFTCHTAHVCNCWGSCSHSRVASG